MIAVVAVVLAGRRGVRSEGRHDVAIGFCGDADDERLEEVESLTDVLHEVGECALEGRVVDATACFVAPEGTTSRMESATALREDAETISVRKSAADKMR